MVVEHDANAAALAERHFGAAAGAATVVFIAIGTGIGSALLLDGAALPRRVRRGPRAGPPARWCRTAGPARAARTAAGSATAAAPPWPPPPSSCWPATAAAPRCCAGSSRADPGRVTGQRVAAAAREGDPVACAAMDELARWLGEGLALVADVFDPELVVIGGGVSESAPLFLDEAREHYARMVTGAGRRPLARIRTAQLGEAAAVVGAAQLAREAGPRARSVENELWDPRPQSIREFALDGSSRSEDGAVVVLVGRRSSGGSGQSRRTSQPRPAARVSRPSGRP